jgi:hypothetical protein
MPLEFRNFRDLDEKPLASGVLEAGLVDAEFHSAGGVDKNLRQLSFATSPDFPVDSLAEVEDARPDGESPRQVSQAMTGGVEGELADEIRVGRVSHKATGGMGIQADHEEESEVMSVPECLEALSSNFLVGGAVHQDHDEQEGVTGDAAWLSVVNLQGGLGTDLSALDIDEIDVMSSGVDHSPERQRVSHLSVEPDVLVRWEEPHHPGTNHANDVPQHGDEDHESVVCENQTCTTACPDRELEAVQSSEPLVRLLRVPAVPEHSEVRAIPQEIEEQPPRRHELGSKPCHKSRFRRSHLGGLEASEENER